LKTKNLINKKKNILWQLPLKFTALWHHEKQLAYVFTWSCLFSHAQQKADNESDIHQGDQPYYHMRLSTRLNPDTIRQ